MAFPLLQLALASEETARGIPVGPAVSEGIPLALPVADTNPELDFGAVKHFQMGPEILDNPFGLDTLDHAGGPQYTSRLQADIAGTRLKLGASFLGASFIIQVGLVLFFNEFRPTRQVLIFGTLAALLQLTPALFIFLGADSLNKKRNRGLVVAGAILAIVTGSFYAMFALFLWVNSVVLCPLFMPAVVQTAFAFCLLMGGVKTFAVLRDPAIEAAFDRHLHGTWPRG